MWKIDFQKKCQASERMFISMHVRPFFPNCSHFSLFLFASLGSFSCGFLTIFQVFPQKFSPIFAASDHFYHLNLIFIATSGVKG